ncbi:filamentous hemagglutinin N-terminal domain-containing protein [Salmonella enterica]|nr:filamentous hemagglutinin N-terminal domain-containing protein [Salmonella enterica]
MNKIYKLKYDRRRQQLVAVSELTTGAGKEATGQVCGLSDISSFRKLLGTLTPLAFLTGLIVSLLPGMALANPSLPTGGQIVAGQGSISTSGNQMTVNQNTQGMVTNWNSFDIGKNHTVQFVQPGSSAVALNRVTGGHESQILGTLKANGQVMLINPAGVMFGKGAKVNTAGLVASTKNISNEDFMAGRYTFSGGSQPGAEIVNQGSLTTTKGGYIVLAADRVRNQGEIRTPGGRVVLAAADRVTLQLDNTGLTAVSVNGSVVNALAENRGLISATNGQVYLTARGKDMLLNTVVNNSGTVEAKGLSERGGEIVLDGGDSGVVSQSGMLLADSDSGRGGKITLEGQNIHLAGGSLISATGETGGGEVYVGGGWQGKDSSIRHASKVVMDKTAVIDVSAKARGQGGTAVLWSDDYTNFRGTILARGGLQGGDGGRVETSSHHNLQAFGDVDASAVKGNAGEWLLDPFDITVVSGSIDTDVHEGTGNDGIFTPDTGTSQVSNGTINNRLNSGTNVTIKTAKENSGSNQWGNITVNADISHTATNNVSLTLEADGNINITNHSITSTTGKLDVNLLGAGSHDGTITLNNATVSSNGGNITLGQLNAGSDGTTSGLAVSITNSTLNATSAGNISITANNGTTLGNGTLSGNEVSVSASSGTGDALAINNGSKLTAAGNLTVSGDTSATGNKYGIHTWGNSQFTAGDTLNMTAEAAGGTDGAFNASNINVSAQNAVIKGTSGGANGTGVKMDGNVTNTMNGGNLTITGTTTGSGAGSIGVNVLANLSTNGTGNLNITGKGAQGIGVNLTNKTLSGGNVTVTGTSGNSNGKGLDVSGTTLNATNGNIVLTGCMTGRNGGFGAHIHGGSSFKATENITITGYAMDGTNGGLNLNGGTFNATSTVLNGTSQNNNLGAKVGGVITVSQGNLSLSGTANRINAARNVSGVVSDGTLSITVSSGTLNVTGKVNDTANNPTNAGTTMGLSLVNTTLNATEVSLSGEVAGGRDGTGASLTNTTINATTGNATLNATVANGNALVVSGGNITAGKDISLTGTAKAGEGYGVSLTNGNMTASSGNISVNGTGYDSGSGALNVNGGNFSAQNTVLEGTAGRNNVGAKLAGNINVTQGNLSVTGTTHHLTNGSYTGLLAGSGLNVNVSQGNLSLAGQALKKDGNDVSGNTVGLNLTNAILSAEHASLKGSSTSSGSGFILNNVTLEGGIARGENMTVSSAGSAASITNTLNINGGLGYGAFESMKQAGIDNKTTVGSLTASQDELKQYMNFSESSDWSFNGASLGGDNWSIAALTGINATTTGNITLTGMGLTNSNLTGSSVSLNGDGNASLTVTNTTLNATTGDVSLSANVANGNALVVSGSNITAGRDIILTGTAKAGEGYGVSLTNGNMTATGNISVTGTGWDSKQGALNVNGGNFSAQNTVLEGTAGRNNVGAKLAGNINVTQGNLSVTGTIHHLNNGPFTGLLAGSGLNVNVSQGNLSLTGQVLKEDGKDASGNTVGLNLTNAILSAEHASLKGSSANSGSGFILNNVTLKGGIARGENMTVSSAGSAASITNTLNINGGLGYGAFESMKQAGIDNKTTVGSLTASQDELKQYMNFSESSDWNFNGASLGGDNWTIAALTGISATTTGNITLTGMDTTITNSNLTGSSVSLIGDGNASLTVTNTTLNATSGNVSLNTSNGTLTVRNVNLSSAGGESTLSGTSLENGTGVKLAGNINVTQGNLTVNGTVNRTGETNVWGIDARDATINVSASGAVLNMTGKVASDSGNGSVSVVGLDLSGNSVLNAHTANLNGTSVTNGYGFLLNSALQGGLTANGSLSLSSKGSGKGVSNQIGSRVSADVVKHMIEQNVSIGSYTDTTITNLYNQANFTQWIAAGNGNLTKDFGDFGLKFSGINITAGNINLTGTSFTNSNLTATSGDLTIDNKGGALGLSNTALNASSGNISLTGGSISLTGGQDVTAGKDIMLNASKGGVNITGQNGSNLKDITSGSGNISINGYSVGAGDSGTDDYKTSGVTLNNASLTASAGKINVSGVSDASYGYVSHNALFTSAGGILLLGNVSLNSTHNTLDGRDVRQGDRYTQLEQQGGIVINPGTFNFIGDTDINAHSENGAGLLANIIGSDATLNFQNGNATINAKTNATLSGSSVIAGISFTSWVYKGSLKFNVDNASLAINAEGNNVNGISPGYSYNNTYKFSGNGNVSVHGSSQTGTGISIRQMDNSGLNGSLTIAGESQSGTGVSLAGGVSLTNATVSGNSQSGTGLQISGSNISDSTLSGNASGSGTGVSLSGNASITDGTVTGNAVDGNGVSVSGNVNTTNTTVTGNATGSGTGVSLSGNASITDGTVTGNAVDGNGVSVSGNVNTTNTTVTGNATGSGTGVDLAGNVTGGTVNGNATDGTGVNVSGDSTLTDVTVNGNTTSGTGVDVNANLTNQGSTTVNGNAGGSGTGVDLAGNVTGGTVNGNATDGTGVNVSGDSTLTDVTVNGNTTSGTGVDVNANLTNQGSTTVNGNATGTGSGVDLAGNVTGGTVNGNATDGTGVNVSGDSTLTDVTVNGNTTSGTGVDVNANLTNQGSTTITGNSGSGAGVGLNGTVTGGSLAGNSVSGPGLHVTGNSTLNGVDVTASSQSGPGTQMDGMLSVSGGTTLNGEEQKDSAELRRQVYERQQQLSRSDTVRDAYRASGYRVEEKPVSVEICTDGECRALETGYADAPKAR